MALPSGLTTHNTILISVTKNLFSYLSNLLVGRFEQVSPRGLGRFRALLSSALGGRSEELSPGMESDGLRKVSDGLRKVSDAPRKVLDGLRKMLDGLRKVSDGLKRCRADKDFDELEIYVKHTSNDTKSTTK